jgi:hypothetical protein
MVMLPRQGPPSTNIHQTADMQAQHYTRDMRALRRRQNSRITGTFILKLLCISPVITLPLHDLSYL